MRRPLGGVVAGLLVAVVLTACAPEATSSTDPPAPSKSPSTVFRSIAVVGDSISVGYNACGKPGPCKAESWATGTDPTVDSIARRLGIDDPHAVHNLAFPGTRMRNASQELARITAPADLVMVLSGANDACQPSIYSMTDAATFATRVREVLAAVDQHSPGATVLMMSVPDVTQLARTEDVPEAVQERRVSAGLCGSVLGNVRRTPSEADRAAVRTRIAEYDAAIATACRASSKCIDDGGALTRYLFDPAAVSTIDYFHPSVKGQRHIADLAWRALVNGRAGHRAAVGR